MISQNHFSFHFKQNHLPTGGRARTHGRTEDKSWSASPAMGGTTSHGHTQLRLARTHERNESDFPVRHPQPPIHPVAVHGYTPRVDGSTSPVIRRAHTQWAHLYPQLATKPDPMHGYASLVDGCTPQQTTKSDHMNRYTFRTEGNDPPKHRQAPSTNMHLRGSRRMCRQPVTHHTGLPLWKYAFREN